MRIYEAAAAERRRTQIPTLKYSREFGNAGVVTRCDFRTGRTPVPR